MGMCCKYKAIYLFNNKQYNIHINHSMTILTGEGNCIRQLDKCYVIV